MAIYLAASLPGYAQAVLTDLDASSIRNYKVLRDALSLRLGNGGEMEVFRSQLKSRIRGKDESLSDSAYTSDPATRKASISRSTSIRLGSPRKGSLC